jgi:hypothetical protein
MVSAPILKVCVQITIRRILSGCGVYEGYKGTRIGRKRGGEGGIRGKRWEVGLSRREREEEEK